MAIPLPSYTEIATLIKKGMNLEAQEKIMELREAALECREENLTLKGRIRELEEQLSNQEQMHFDGRIYWKGKRGVRGPDNGPYCPACYEKDGKLIRLQHHHGDGDTQAHYRCLVCKTILEVNS